jgi:hypothetical protein
MERRKQLGLEIAAYAKIERKGGVWMVPSQSGRGRYTVCLDPEASHCTCPDHDQTGKKCKHIFAVEFAIEREQGVAVGEPPSGGRGRKTYGQHWPAYNAAQTNEKHEFQALLFDLCQGIPNPPRGKGRPPLTLSDMLFAANYKVYSTFSGRRFMTDLADAYEHGFTSALPHWNSIFKYLKDPALSPILHELIVKSSLPLVGVESVFAADSTGFTGTPYIRWYDVKYRGKQEHEWVKPHLMCGVNTHIVTDAIILDRNASDTRQLRGLLKTTAQNFVV